MYLSKIYSNYSLNFDFAHNYMAILEYIIIFLYKPLTYNALPVPFTCINKTL